jgi:insulysin
MGTKKYPAQNAYQQFLSSNNGMSNAYTAMTSTNYYFDIAPDALEGALDRFSGFFIEPLFNEDCTEREIKAVDSEHKKNLQNDMWASHHITTLALKANQQRFYQLEKHLSKPGHVYRKFGTGNYNSLWSEPKADGRDPRQQLMKWWEKEYCAKRMKLVVIGKDSIETLEKWVKEKFEAVPVRTEGAPAVGPKGQRVVFEESPTNPDRMGVSFSP